MIQRKEIKIYQLKWNVIMHYVPFIVIKPFEVDSY
jgi:hypothetical protein